MSRHALKPQQIRDLRGSLLVWYDRHARALPWRLTEDPYSIWVSEIMLQQTRVVTVLEYYKRFLARFPTLASLAEAGEDEVLTLWSGLGYYRRARMLHRTAQLIMAEHQGRLPATFAELRKLPGVGEYTAAAIASIAFEERVAAVDGNVLRVITRLVGFEKKTAAAPAAFLAKARKTAQRLIDIHRPGDFNQAMMELGATLCLPADPLCRSCPVHSFCGTRGEHPTTPRKKMLSRQVAYALVVRKRTKHGHLRTEVLLQKRGADTSLMPDMWELPQPSAGVELPESPLLSVRHSITTTNYYVSIFPLDVKHARQPEDAKATRQWVHALELPRMPLTGLTRKVLKRLKVWPGYSGAALPVLLPGARPE